MPQRVSKSGSELFIVDNSVDEWKVLRYLHDWCQLSKSIDVATGYFEIGSLLALKDEWQKVEKIRVLMGDEVSKRTRKAFEAGIKLITERLDGSLEIEKQKDDFLTGVPAIVDAIRAGKIECRVYRKDKFHAKAYLTHARQEVVGSFGLVGSSNFTYPGLTENVELNVQITGTPVRVLQEWYEEHWEAAEDVSMEILRVIDRHVQEYSPFDIYAKALYELFRSHQMTATEWERRESQIYPILAPYQREGYHSLLERAKRFRGAFLCDGVGLGKTFIGLMLIERLILHDRLNVALFVPKAARESVWERLLREKLPSLFGKYTQLAVFNHTDLLRDSLTDDLESVRQRAHVILVDEAHHFRNTGIHGDPDDPQSRYWKLYQLAEGKTLFMLTATPVNNRLLDLQHMIELFSRREAAYFKDAPLGIHSLPGHFRKLENALDRIVRGKERQDTESLEDLDTNIAEAEKVLGGDELFGALVVQRSRAYVKRSSEQEGVGEILFPKPREPKVVEYSVKQTYGKVLRKLEEAFSRDKPLFRLVVYYPFEYYKGDDQGIPALARGRQRQVVSLIRIGFLKRFESSVEAFRMSCWALLKKLLAWVEVHAETPHEKRVLERWRRQHADVIKYVYEQQRALFEELDDVDADEDIVTPEMREAVEKLSRDLFKVDEIIDETMLDLNQLADFLQDLQQFSPAHDKKLSALLNLLQSDPILRREKVLIFTEFMDTARYLKKQLREAGVPGVEEIDSGIKEDRSDLIRRFSPYYNGSSSHELVAEGKEEIRVLISTDVLAEGLNLQDATRLLNYDIHWNPVRLMQRIGRIDRRMSRDIEARIIADHPRQKTLRGDVAYWNFLPPDELDTLLRLYQRVAHKTLKISKTFGIEGKKLLKPEDDYDALRDFTEQYEGGLSPIEEMHLELQALLKTHPDLEERLIGLPGRVFSGRRHPSPDSQAVFLCYALPALLKGDGGAEDEALWTLEAGVTQWYLFDIRSERVLDDPVEIANFIRSTRETPRVCVMRHDALTEIRRKVEKHIKNNYLKRVDAPMGVNPTLKCWMEMNQG